MIINPEKLFKSQFIATFLASWCANNYEAACDSDNHEALYTPPVEDAEFLADQAWAHYMKVLG